MSVPTYDQFIEPILRFLAAHPEGAMAGEAHEAAAMAKHSGRRPSPVARPPTRTVQAGRMIG